MLMKMEEILKLDGKTIQAKVEAMKIELFTLKMQHATSGLEKPHKVKILKKNIARLLTVKKQKSE